MNPGNDLQEVAIDQGLMPEMWSRSSKNEEKPHRPASLTCECCKLMESIIKDDKFSDLFKNNCKSHLINCYTQELHLTSWLFSVTHCPKRNQHLVVLYYVIPATFHVIYREKIDFLCDSADKKSQLVNIISELRRYCSLSQLFYIFSRTTINLVKNETNLSS